MASVVSRTAQRQTFAPEVRTALLESDMDEADTNIATILSGQQKLMWWAMGLVASLMTTSVLLFVNLVK